MNTRKNDIRGERALGLYMDTYLYPKLVEKGVIDSFQRNFQVSQQKAGTDVQVSIGGQTKNIDEKAQLHSIGKPRSSFVVEIDFISIRSNKVVDGWFMSRSNITDIYMFAWINRAKTNLSYRIVSEDFEEVEVAFVEKNKIRQYLSDHGFSIPRIQIEAKKIRNQMVDAKEISGTGFHFSFTQDREERPINIVLEKDLIVKMADARYVVSKEKIQSLM